MAHINYLYDYTVTAFIVNLRGQVLLVHHPRYSKWIPVGGHIEMNEDPEEALYREVKEETGLQVKLLSSRPDIESVGTKILVTPNYVDVHEANAPHKHISFTYFMTTDQVEFILSPEHDEMRWFSPEDLNDPVYELSNAVKFYAMEALKTASHRQ